MSDTSNLSINISARDTAAAQIRGLQGTIRDLEKEIRRAAQTGLDTGGAYIGVLQKQHAAIQEQIAALRGQATAVRDVTTAIVAQGDAAAVVHRTLSQGIDVSLGANYDRAIKSASASAQVLATSLSAAAEADARFRESELATADAARIATESIRAQGSAVRTLTGEQFFGVVQRKVGLGQAGLSAEASAETFRRELGPVGGGLTLTPAAGFSRVVSDLAGVKQSYLSAADSAKVFAAAGEQGIGGVAKGAALLQRESRHIVGLFDSLARGQRGQAFSSIGAAARDAGIGTAGLATSIGGLIAIMATMAILHHAESLGKWATEMRAAAGATGMSVSAYSALSAALRELGFSGHEADASMRHMARSLSTAISQPASRAAEAFHNLGISQEQLVANGNNVNGILHLLADAYVRTADGANKTANMEELLGRAFQQLIPLLQDGGAGLDKMTEKQTKLGTTTDKEGSAKLIAMGKAVHELSAALSGEGTQAMIAWSGTIIALAHTLEYLGKAIGFVVNGLGKLTDPNLGIDLYGLRKAKTGANARIVPGIAMPQFAAAPGMAAVTSAQPAADAAKVAVPPLTPPITPLENMRLQMAQGAAAAAQSTGNAQKAREAEARAEITAMQRTLQTAQLTAQQRVQIETELAQKQIALANEERATQAATARAGAAAARQSYADFAAAERLKITAADGSMAKIVAVYNEWLTQAENRFKQSAAIIENIERQMTQAINADRLRQIKQGASDVELIDRAKAALGGAQTTVARQQPGTAVAASQNVGDFAAQAGQIQARAQTEVQALTEVMNTAQQGSATQRDAAKEILSVVSRAKQQETALYKKAAAAAQEATQKMTEPFKHMFDALGSQFTSLSDSLVKDLLAPKIDLIKQGLTTIKINERSTQIHQVLQQFALQLVTDATNTLETTLSKFAASSLSGLLNIPLGAGGGMSGLLAGGLGKLFGMGGGAASGVNAAQFGIATSQLQVASTQLQVAAATLQAGAAASSASSAAKTAVGAPGLLAGVTSFFGLFAAGGIVPSAAGGMVVGGNGGSLSILHAQEMVLPAHLSRGLQAMINAGGATGRGNQANLHYAPTINTGTRSGRSGTGMTRAEFAQTMASHGGRMMGEARNLVRAGWRPG